jgi:hypothetical protein
MAHYAKVVDGKVTQVIVAEKEFFDTFVDTSPGTWIQTSYNTIGGQHTQGGTPLRGNYAGIGYTYDHANDVFYAPQPYASWTISAPTWTWTAPTPMPVEEGKFFFWDEPTVAWKEVIPAV